MSEGAWIGVLLTSNNSDDWELASEILDIYESDNIVLSDVNTYLNDNSASNVGVTEDLILIRNMVIDKFDKYYKTSLVPNRI
ncbi:hypothetical protein [Foetidibacter luteolus]|uniref:hypothetical protein n=1 Tax=Foetidibacter luteolus TaxID=2608880 RepID=UPI00129B84A6|nr:hypothetical protein [Foetidibacter luteolus]